jgi:hypothetical protein
MAALEASLAAVRSDGGAGAEADKPAAPVKPAKRSRTPASAKDGAGKTPTKTKP